MIVRGNAALIQFVLIAWIPLTLLLFAVMRPRRAVLTSVIGALLLLPSANLELPGLPGTLSRYSAAGIGCLLGALLFDFRALSRFRLAWFDWPAVALVFVSVPTSVLNGLGAYDGFSEAYGHVVLFGIPYFLGRVYFDHPAAHRDLALAVIISAVLYAPLSLWEIRMSPQLHHQVYGFYSVPFMMFARFSGYRPIVFMDSPLMLGMWMSAACMLAFWLGVCCKGFRIRDYPIAWLLPFLLVALVFGKTVGAAVLFFVAAGIFVGARWFGAKFALVVILVGFMSYPALRSLGELERTSIVSVVAPIFPIERVHSLDFRLENEDRVISKALTQPWFGWGGWDRNRTDETRAIDGLWLSVFGKNGVVGLVALLCLFAIPVVLFYRRLDARDWANPNVAPLSGLAVLICLYWVDCLSNGFVNPVFMMAMGGLSVSLGTAQGRAALSRAARRVAASAPRPVEDAELPGTPVGVTLGPTPRPRG